MNNVRYEKHIFVCVNERAPDHPRVSCGEEHGKALVKEFKKRVKEKGLKMKVRPQRCNCMDICEWGPNVVVYPEGVFYGGVALSDVDEIFEEHILGDRPVKRLISDFSTPPDNG